MSSIWDNPFKPRPINNIASKGGISKDEFQEPIILHGCPFCQKPNGPLNGTILDKDGNEINHFDGAHHKCVKKFIKDNPSFSIVSPRKREYY